MVVGKRNVVVVVYSFKKYMKRQTDPYGKVMKK